MATSHRALTQGAWVQAPIIKTPIIGYHHSPLSQKFGIPRQPNLVQLPTYIKMIAPYHIADAFDGIERFSHLWITWQAHYNNNHHNDRQRNENPLNHSPLVFKPKVRPPRLGGNTKLGVFATRSTYRPSQLGLSVVKLLEVELVDNGVMLHISGADMLDGTPIIDIKPYIAYSDAVVHSTGDFASAGDKPSKTQRLNKPDSKSVQLTPQATIQLSTLITQSATHHIDDSAQAQNRPPYKYSSNKLTPNDIDIICQLIAQDPRPAYRRKESKHVFIMRYKDYDVHFKMNENHEMSIVSIVSLSDTYNLTANS